MLKWSNLFARKPPEYQEYEKTQQNKTLRFSHTYRRHFEDYAYREMTDKNGKTKMVRVYAGVYYTPMISRRAQALRKLSYSMFWLLCGGALVFSAGCELKFNFLKQGALIYGLVCLALLWILSGLINYLIAPMHRTIGEWRDSAESLKKSTVGGTIAFALCAGMNLIQLLAQRNQVSMRLCCVLVCLVGGGTALLWSVLEKKTVYEQSESNETEHTIEIVKKG
jgi:hypothetical protein